VNFEIRVSLESRSENDRKDLFQIWSAGIYDATTQGNEKDIVAQIEIL
jgi:hypothetical protein